MNCGHCIRFKVYETGSQVSLGHCRVKGKNVVESDIACENFVNDKILDVYERLFVCRRDTYATQQEDGTYRRVDGWLTKTILKDDLAGEVTVGAYQTRQKDNRLKWIVFDIDPQHTENPEADLRDIYRACLEKDRVPMKAILLEASRHPDPSYHVWVFFEPEFSTPAARWLAKTILEKAGVVCEVFPKQSEVKEGEFGNLVKLPLGFHREEKKWSCFLDPETLEPLKPEAITKIEGLTFSEKETKRMLELAEAPRRDVQTKLKSERGYRGKDPVCILKSLDGFEEGQPSPFGRNEAGIRLASYWLNFRKLKDKTVQKRLKEWNEKNQPPLGERELESIFDSALAKEYVFGCDDDLLKLFCVGRSECALGQSGMSDLELVEAELEKQRAVKLHPLIDYHDLTGLHMGTLLGNTQKSLIILGEKAFTTEFETPMLREEFPIPLSVREVSGCFLQPNRAVEILLLSSELMKSKDFTFKAQSKVAKKVLQRVCYYWWYPDERYQTAVSSFIIGSYMFPIFDAFPVLHIQGVRESGKSTLLWVLWLLSWNPTQPEASLREAGLFRTIQGSRPTYLVDITRFQKRGEGTADVIDVFELGFERGGTIRRCDKDTLEPSNFEVFSPKCIATREDIQFGAKAIGIISEKTEDPVYTKRRTFLKEDPEAKEIIGDLIRSALKTWPKVLEVYKTLEQTDKLKGRRFRLWAPLLAVCKVYMTDHYESLLELAHEDAERQEAGDRVSEVEDAVLAIVAAQEKPTWLLKELTEQVGEQLSWVESWHPVKSSLKNLAITKKKYQTSRGVTYSLDLKKAKELAERKGITLEPSSEGESEETRYGNCEVCGKPGALGYLRDNRWIFLHDECRENYEGDL